MRYLNLAAYKFISLEAASLPALQQQLQQQALAQQIKGTILLSHEGINLFLAATPQQLEGFTTYLKKIPAFADLWFKESQSDYIPFKRMLVRIKKEIIAMNKPEIEPEKTTAPYLEPHELRKWYQQNQDMVLIDTRNHYETQIGTFEQATHFNIENFNEFPQAISTLPESFKTKTIVTYCTGGIRCEKAAAYLLSQGFSNVWQLKGGILNYFEQCGSDYFSGDCFVFDDRRAVNPHLEPV